MLRILKPYTGLKMQEDYEKKEGKKGRTKIHCVVLNVPPLREERGKTLGEVLPCLSFSHALHKTSLALVHFAWTYLCPEPVHLSL